MKIEKVLQYIERRESQDFDIFTWSAESKFGYLLAYDEIKEFIKNNEKK